MTRFKIKKPTAMQKSLILSLGSGIGVITTSVLSAKCAKKTSDDLTFWQKVKAYLPALVSGGLTLGCIGGSAYFSHEEVAAVTAACVAIGRRFADYRKSVNGVVTDEQREQIDISFYEKEIDRLEQELAEREHPTDDDDLVTFIDSFSGYSFKARLEDVEERLEKVNAFWEENEYLCLCDIPFVLNDGDDILYYSGLGEGGSWFHNGWGWSKAMLEELGHDPDAFGVHLLEVKSRENTYLIDYPYSPEPCFMEY